MNTTETSAKMAHIPAKMAEQSAETAHVSAEIAEVLSRRNEIKTANDEILAATLLIPIFADAGDRRALVEYAERIKRNAEEIIFLSAE